ncbi:MAG: hypothetical protein CMD46_02200 [Gammaproteobacteria bacterium]|nr:hypothetical protein [Gammaproteobacteria bacterium]
MFLETTLLFKTLVILSGQLIVILATCFYFLVRAKKAYENNTTFFGISFKGSVNLKGKLNLIPYLKPKETFPKKMAMYVDNKSPIYAEAKDQDEVIELLKKGYSHYTKGAWRIVLLFFFNVVALWSTLVLVNFFSSNIFIGMTIFTLCSASFGPLLAVIMLEMDENDGFTALKIVFFVTLLTGFIGYGDFYSFSQNGIFGTSLCLSLFGLIIFNIVRYFKEFSRNTIKASAIFGAILFSGYLLYDFNYIKMQEGILGSNDWGTAMKMAFILYLDIINLLLEILEAMSD